MLTMDEDAFIITGGNTGIGKAIALSLAKMGAHVVIISRDSRKGKQALEDIRKSNPGGRSELVVGDLGTIDSIRRLSSTLLERYAKIHALINNAGVWPTEKTINPDGLEISFVVNHMAPFILSNLLFERMNANAPSRIVNVNAGLYVTGRVDLEKTPYGHDFNRLRTYANTKLCNMLFTREFAERIKGSGVTINALHPGVIRTNLGASKGILGALLNLVKRSFGPPEKGARAPVWLATAPELEAVSGKYYNVKTETEMTETARDVELATGLWELSCRLAGLSTSV